MVTVLECQAGPSHRRNSVDVMSHQAVVVAMVRSTRTEVFRRVADSAGLAGISGGHLVLVGGECSQHLVFLLRGDFEEVERSPKFGGDLVELGGGDL